MKTKRVVWTVVFLSITLAAIVMEVVAGIFHPAGTIPWTEYLARYVPWPIQLAAYVILAVWLPFHFWRHDHLRKVAYKQGMDEGFAQGHQWALEASMDHFEQRGVPLMPHSPIPAMTARRGGIQFSDARPGEPMCSHGYAFGRSDHHCGELPSDAVKFVPARLGLSDAAGNDLARGLGIDRLPTCACLGRHTCGR